MEWIREKWKRREPQPESTWSRHDFGGAGSEDISLPLSFFQLIINEFVVQVPTAEDLYHRKHVAQVMKWLWHFLCRGTYLATVTLITDAHLQT